MTPRLLLSEPTANLCELVCAGCTPAGAADAGPAACAAEELLPSASSSELRKRWVRLPKPRCARCELLLLMQAIDRLVPADERAEWLGRPNPDLGGRPPAGCIRAGDYESVFTALFLMDPIGPVS